jgi:hypothetical protein
MDRLEKAIGRHGGQQLWKELQSIEIQVHSLGGPLPRMKGIGRSFPTPHRVKVFPKLRRVRFENYDVSGRTGVFDRGAIGIVDENSGNENLIRNYRTTFSSFRKHLQWGPLDAIYFFGYALTTYLSIPFILKELPHQIREWKNGFVIEAEFPPKFDTHCKIQKFYFDEEGLLIRHDYTAEIVGSWAKGAHFTTAYHQVDGLMIAQSRNVFARLGPWVTPIPVLWARLEGRSIEFARS